MSGLRLRSLVGDDSIRHKFDLYSPQVSDIHFWPFLSLFPIAFQSTVYYILVMISGLILGFFWGVMFGVLVFFFNWFLHPLYKLIFLFLQLVAMLVRPGIRIFTDPVFESIALCYRNIKGTMDVNLHKWPADDSKADYTELSAVSWTKRSRSTEWLERQTFLFSLFIYLFKPPNGIVKYKHTQ